MYDTLTFTQAFSDALHKGITGALGLRTHHTMFVDDKISVAIRSRM
jgi:hypothetical protein